MVLRKIIIDNIVRCISKSEQTKEKDMKTNTKKIVNKTKVFQKTVKKGLPMS